MYKASLPYRKRMYKASLRDDFIINMSYEISYLLASSKRKYKIDTVRVHESGDFYSQKYVDKWMEIAKLFQRVKFYAYTKSYKFDFSIRPNNFKIKLSLDPTSKEEALEYVPLFDGVTWISDTGEEMSEFITCPGSCKKCSVCVNTSANVEFKKH